jgi:hypothetical protein
VVPKPCIRSAPACSAIACRIMTRLLGQVHYQVTFTLCNRALHIESHRPFANAPREGSWADSRRQCLGLRQNSCRNINGEGKPALRSCSGNCDSPFIDGRQLPKCLRLQDSLFQCSSRDEHSLIVDVVVKLCYPRGRIVDHKPSSSKYERLVAASTYRYRIKRSLSMHFAHMYYRRARRPLRQR